MIKEIFHWIFRINEMNQLDPEDNAAFVLNNLKNSTQKNHFFLHVAFLNDVGDES